MVFRRPAAGSECVKIYILINSLGQGGAERVIQSLANHWTGGGAKVVIALLHDLPVAYSFAAGVEMISLAGGRILSGPARLFSLAVLARRWARLVRDGEATHAFSLLPRANLVNCLSRHFGNPHPIVISEHSMPGLIYRGFRPGKTIMRRLIRLLYPRARNVIAVSTAVRSELLSLGVKCANICVVPNPQSLDVIRAHSQTAADLPELKDKPRLITVGRLLAVKDHETLLKAFGEIRRSVDAQLIIVGDGPERPRLEKIAGILGLSDDIWFAGWRDNPFAIMARCQGYMHSSRFESFGNVLIEAMACGLPVVATACPGGITDIFDRELVSQLVPVGDWRGLADKALALLQDPGHCEAVKAACRDRARAFDVAQIAPRYEELAALARQTTKKPAAA